MEHEHGATGRTDAALAGAVARATVFLSGWALMTVQLSASRLLARHTGHSLFTWTAILAVMLSGMAAGNAWGGRVADRTRPRSALFVLLALCSLSGFALAPINHWSGARVLANAAGNGSWRLLAHVAAVLFAPSVLMGMVDPVATRWAVARAQRRASAFGALYAWGVIGNLLGALLTGFALIALLPVSVILVGAAGLFALMAVALRLVPVAETDRRAQATAASAPAPGTGLARRRSRVLAAALAGLAGFSLMATELAAGRMLARDFGHSLYVWTSAIAVCFAGMTLGVYVGARRAPRMSQWRQTALVLAAAALVCPAALWLHGRLLEAVLLWRLFWPARIALHAALTFTAPAAAMGLCMALAARWRLGADRVPTDGELGQAIGGLFAWISVGSVLGVLLTGFVLMERLGMRGVALLAGALPAAALFVAGLARARAQPARRWRTAAACAAWLGLWIALFGATAGREPLAAIGEWLGLREGADAFLLYRAESAYYHIEVKRDPYNPAVRHLYLDKLKHSMTNMREPHALQYAYERIYAAALEERFGTDRPLRALALGGGGYTFPRHLALTRPGSAIEAVEIDPAVTRAARAAMGFRDSPAIAVTHGDAALRVRTLLAARAAESEPPARFHAILGDAINDYSVPYHLTTREFLGRLHALLEPDGILLMTVIDLLDSGRFVGAVANTCGEVFRHVHVFATHDDSASRDTFVVAASDRVWQPTADFPARLLTEAEMAALRERSRGRVLTDEYAPVENLLAPVVRANRASEGEILLRRAVRLHARRRYADSLAACRQALAVGHDRYAVRDMLAMNLTLLGRFADAAREWEAAVALWPAVPTLRNHLGTAYFQLGELAAAVEEWEEALRLDPGNAEAQRNLDIARQAPRRP